MARPQPSPHRFCFLVGVTLVMTTWMPLAYVPQRSEQDTIAWDGVTGIAARELSEPDTSEWPFSGVPVRAGQTAGTAVPNPTTFPVQAY
jgi:hypothetical protein